MPNIFWENIQFIEHEQCIFTPKWGVADAFSIIVPTAATFQVELWFRQRPDLPEDPLVDVGSALPRNYNVAENPDDYTRANYIVQDATVRSGTFLAASGQNQNINAAKRWRFPTKAQGAGLEVNGIWQDYLVYTKIVPLTTNVGVPLYDDQSMVAFVAQRLQDIYESYQPSNLPVKTVNLGYIYGSVQGFYVGLVAVCVRVVAIPPQVGRMNANPLRLIHAGGVAFGRNNEAFF